MRGPGHRSRGPLRDPTSDHIYETETRDVWETFYETSHFRDFGLRDPVRLMAFHRAYPGGALGPTKDDGRSLKEHGGRLLAAGTGGREVPCRAGSRRMAGTLPATAPRLVDWTAEERQQCRRFSEQIKEQISRRRK